MVSVVTAGSSTLARNALTLVHGTLHNSDSEALGEVLNSSHTWKINLLCIFTQSYSEM